MPEDPMPFQQSRRTNGPVTDRGARRKHALLQASRRVFEEKGFMDARVADIVREANVAHGTFYTYYDTKEAVFEAVARDVVKTMLAELRVPPPSTSNVHERVRDAMRRYINAYRPAARIIALMEQVGVSSPVMRHLRLELREAFTERTRRGIERLKQQGLADPKLDEEYTADALGAMLEYTCYMWFTLGHPYEDERLVESLSTIWGKALLPLNAASRQI